MTGIAFIITGLPAGGKSTVGGLVARLTGFALLDKDDFLERLFAECGVGDADWRRTLSRDSDRQFRAAAERCPDAVLVSHWTPKGATGTGTPHEWLAGSFGQIVEVFCDCPATAAAQRFANRRRHPGHLDHLKGVPEIRAWMAGMEAGFPLGLGALVRVDTTGEIDEAALRREIDRLTGR